MTLIMNQGWPDGHPLKNGGVMIGFVKRRPVSSENQSPKLAQEDQKTEATKDADYPSTVVGTAK